LTDISGSFHVDRCKGVGRKISRGGRG